MLLPCASDHSLATLAASFGFPEIRRGSLPGIVSIAAKRRLSEANSKRLMMTGMTPPLTSVLTLTHYLR